MTVKCRASPVATCSWLERSISCLNYRFCPKCGSKQDEAAPTGKVAPKATTASTATPMVKHGLVVLDVPDGRGAKSCYSGAMTRYRLLVYRYPTLKAILRTEWHSVECWPSIDLTPFPFPLLIPAMAFTISTWHLMLGKSVAILIRLIASRLLSSSAKTFTFSAHITATKARLRSNVASALTHRHRMRKLGPSGLAGHPYFGTEHDPLRCVL